MNYVHEASSYQEQLDLCKSYYCILLCADVKMEDKSCADPGRNVWEHLENLELRLLKQLALALREIHFDPSVSQLKRFLWLQTFIFL